MPNFHETIMGNRFFNGQLPQLIKAINRLAEAIEEQNRREEKKTTNSASEECSKKEQL